MRDLNVKFEKDRTKTAATIEDRQTNRQTDRPTDRQVYTQVILYLCSVMHCIAQTINKLI